MQLWDELITIAYGIIIFLVLLGFTTYSSTAISIQGEPGKWRLKVGWEDALTPPEGANWRLEPTLTAVITSIKGPLNKAKLHDSITSTPNSEENTWQQVQKVIRFLYLVELLWIWNWRQISLRESINAQDCTFYQRMTPREVSVNCQVLKYVFYIFQGETLTLTV